MTKEEMIQAIVNNVILIPATVFAGCFGKDVCDVWNVKLPPGIPSSTENLSNALGEHIKEVTETMTEENVLEIYNNFLSKGYVK